MKIETNAKLNAANQISTWMFTSKRNEKNIDSYNRKDESIRSQLEADLQVALYAVEYAKKYRNSYEHVIIETHNPIIAQMYTSDKYFNLKPREQQLYDQLAPYFDNFWYSFTYQPITEPSHE